MTSNPSPLHTLAHSPIWNRQQSAIWFASLLTLRRNLAHYKFPSKMQEADFAQVLEKLKKDLFQISELEAPSFFPQKEMQNLDEELLLEHFYLLKGPKEPPNGSGAILDKKGRFLAWINGDNHLELHGINADTHFGETWNTLAKVEETLSKSHGFAFTSRFGYLTADPSLSGTGLTLTAYLHLPALRHTGQLPGALTNATEDEVTFTTLSGRADEIIGDIIAIQNTYTLGVSEEAIFKAIETSITKLVGAEKTMRNHLREEENPIIKDLVSKSFGLLVHSYQLETKEALDLLSLMKLGLEIGAVLNTDDEKLSRLFLQCRRGHLSHLFPEVKDPSELAKKRAEFLQRELTGISLKGS